MTRASIVLVVEVRRFFLIGSATVVLIAGVALYAIFSTGDPAATGEGHRVSLTTLDELEEIGVVEVPEHNLFVVYNDGDPLVLSAYAQHVPGELVIWCERSQLFESPAHGEKFDSRGFYYGGPARSGLARLEYELVDGVIYVTLPVPTDPAPTGPPRGAGPAHEPQGKFCT